MIWRRSILLTLVLACVACTSAPPPAPGPGASPWSWEDLAERGLAIAPVAGVQVIAGSTSAPSDFAEELYLAMQSVLPRSPVIEAEEIFARLEDAGPSARARMRSLRRRLIRQRPLDPAELTAIRDDVQQRFILVAFMHEGSEDGIHRTTLDDFEAFDYSMDVHSYPTGELHGVAIGFLLDLEDGVAMWRGEVDYQTEGLATAGAASGRLIELTRADAALRLAESLGELSSGQRL